MRVALIIMLVSCAGARGALDDAGPEVAARHGSSRVQYFGEGCYAVGDRHTIYACSIDVLPVGQRLCTQEPGDGRGIAFENSRLASFERELNSHRCHRRWQQQIACDAVDVEARPSTRTVPGTAPWPSDLG